MIFPPSGLQTLAGKALSTLPKPDRFVWQLVFSCRRVAVAKACLLPVAAMIIAAAAGCAGPRPFPPEPLPPPASRSQIEEPVPATARQLLEAQLAQWNGVPYRRGGMSAKGVDCSGFVYLTFRERFSLELPRTTEGLASTGVRIALGELASGDLVFFRTSREGNHVGIYLGDGRFVHASLSSGVIGSSLANSYWVKHFWQARRVLPPVA